MNPYDIIVFISGAYVGHAIIEISKYVYSYIVANYKENLNDIDKKWEVFKGRKYKKYDRFFSFLENAQVNNGLTNPNFLKLIPPDDKEVTYQVFEIIYTYKSEDEDRKFKKIGKKNVNETLDICSIGGPLSNRYTYDSMGYESPRTKSHKDIIEKIDLPYKFIIDEQQLKNKEFVKIKIGLPYSIPYLGIPFIKKVPNWEIIDRNSNLVGCPEINTDRTLKTDYILLTVLPNIYYPKSYKKKKHLMISGAHNVGMLAFEKILQNESVIDKIDKKCNGEYFQLLAKITKIDWDKKYKKFIPSEIDFNKISIEEIKVPKKI